MQQDLVNLLIIQILKLA